ncbi:MAG: flagellar filament capping protein FliD [Treponema sp.]|nr:flagellar filament capping protein FliD [Treponema sp.]
MADGLNIPGVSNRYKTNDLVEALMEAERVPLKREQAQLETYKKQQDAWRGVNQKMSGLRESVKTLYSFDNPFNNKLSSSSDENALTVDAGREAEYGSFKIEIIKPAASDRFLSGNIDKDFKVPEGKYTFEVGEKTIDFNWKGGKLQDFVTALNKRGGSIIKAGIIGVSANKKSLLLESLKTGKENSLVLKNAALELAKSIDMIGEVKTKKATLNTSLSSLKTIKTQDKNPQAGLPEISKNAVSSDGKNLSISQRGGFELEFPDDVKNKNSKTVEFTFSLSDSEEITEALNKEVSSLTLPDSGKVEFGGITVFNNPSQASLPSVQQQVVKEKLVPVTDDSIFFVKNKYGLEVPVEESDFYRDEETGRTTVKINLKDYPDAVSLIVRNSNTAKTVSMSVPETYETSASRGFEPKHAISTADDAQIKYEGITMTRSSNDIDDVIPHITLHLHDKSEKPVNVKIEPDTQSAKDALITFVGKYNQTIAELNILSQNKPELVSELDYLSESEADSAKERLGMFQGDFTLTNGKNALQRTITSPYKYSEDAEITLLSQIGISSNASSGTRGYNPSQMRGYLEVDEKKLDENLASHLNDIKNLFGFDSDGDLVIDSGIGYMLDKQLTSYVQSSGVISSKTSTLESQIKNSNQKISRLETQLDEKERELKSKYASMEGSLNSLEGQSSSINNFSNSFNNNRK